MFISLQLGNMSMCSHTGAKDVLEKDKSKIQKKRENDWKKSLRRLLGEVGSNQTKHTGGFCEQKETLIYH